MITRIARRPVAQAALRRLRRRCAAGLGAFAIALLLQCSIGHPLVGIWPREDKGDEPNYLALLLLGSASGAFGSVARPILIAAQNSANGGRLSLFACSASGDCTHTDISAGQAANSGVTPVARVNVAARRLMVVTANSAAGSRPYLYNCALDGSDCSAADASGGGGDVANPSFVLDTVNQKALISSQDTSQGQAASLWRCNFDGSGCQYLDLSWGLGLSGLGADTVIDSINNRTLTVSNDGSVGQVPVLTWCAIDGTGCNRTNISSGAGANSGFLPSVLVEPNSTQLIVVTEDGSNGSRLALFRSNLDGTVPNYTTAIAAGQGGLSGQRPHALLDSLNAKILVVTQNGANGNRVSLFRCDLDGVSNCTHTDISAGQPNNSGIFPTAVIDSANQKLLVAAQNTANGDRVSMYRCNLDGSACEHFDASAGQSASSGFRPWIALAP